jgi:hypothetical protein
MSEFLSFIPLIIQPGAVVHGLDIMDGMVESGSCAQIFHWQERLA